MHKRIIAMMAAIVLAGALMLSCAKGVGAGSTPPGDGDGHPGMDLVAGGAVMTSTHYRLVLTTGQGPGGNSVATSTNYTLFGGLIGSTQ